MLFRSRSEFEGMLACTEAARDAAGVSETNAAQSENDAAGYADFAEHDTLAHCRMALFAD